MLELLPPYVTYLYSVVRAGDCRLDGKDFRPPQTPLKDKKPWQEGFIAIRSDEYTVEKIKTFQIFKKGKRWVYKYLVDFTGYTN